MTDSADPDPLVSRNQLIWIYSVCKGRIYPGSAGQGLIFFIISPKKHVVGLWQFQRHLNYSWLSLSRTRLSRIVAYLEVKIWSLPKHENLTTCKKYCGKEEKLLLKSNLSSFPQYFQYISIFRSQIAYSFVKCGCSIYCFPHFCNSDILRHGYLEVFQRVP